MHGGQAGGGNFDQGHIAALVDADHLGDEFAAVGELDRHFRGIAHHMRVGEHITVRTHDESRADPFHGRCVPGRRHLIAAEKLRQRIVGIARLARLARSVHFLRLLDHADIDHRGAVLGDQSREIGQSGHARRGRRRRHRQRRRSRGGRGRRQAPASAFER